MKKGRLEAFSDGVLAILITIMVLELKIPHGTHFSDLKMSFPGMLGYLLSFIYLGIYWNNHHHLLHAVKQVSGGIMWANLHLLFWLSLVPFITGWNSENHFEPLPMAIYGFVLLMSGLAYVILQSLILSSHGCDSHLAEALGKDYKGKISAVLYTLSIPAAFWHPLISGVIYILVAIMWLIPDKRIEKALIKMEEIL